jgi:hypothetical protein
MKRSIAALSALGCVGLCACTPVHIRPLKQPDPAQQATVSVYRESAAHSALISVILGVDGQDVVELDNNQIATFYLMPGDHDFYVRSSQGDVPLHLQLNIEAKKLVCMKTGPHDFTPAELLPFYFQSHSAFVLAAGDCPAAADLAKFETVPVQYTP